MFIPERILILARTAGGGREVEFLNEVAVDTVSYADLEFVRLDVNIARSERNGFADNRIHEADGGRVDRGVLLLILRFPVLLGDGFGFGGKVADSHRGIPRGEKRGNVIVYLYGITDDKSFGRGSNAVQRGNRMEIRRIGYRDGHNSVVVHVYGDDSVSFEELVGNPRSYVLVDKEHIEFLEGKSHIFRHNAGLFVFRNQTFRDHNPCGRDSAAFRSLDDAVHVRFLDKTFIGKGLDYR